MQWWNDFLDWLNSDNGSRIVSTAVIPFVAIVVAGIVAAMIGRASARKVIELSEREVRASAVTALISAARKAAVWNTLPAPEQQHIDHLIGDAEIRLRLLPIAGTGLAADWARHEIAGMKRNAISFSFQAEQSLLVFRDRLIEWQGRPSRAKRLFKNDLDSWAYDSSASEQELVHQQQKWAAQQVTETGPIAAVTSSPFTRPLVPAPIHTPLAESAAAIAAGNLAASLASAAAPLAAASAAVTVAAVAVTPETVTPETVAAVAVTPETVTPEAVTPETGTPETVTPEASAAALVEPSFSSSEAALPADNEPHPLVEPADTSSRDVSEASIFGGNPPHQVSEPEPEQVESEHAEPVHAEAEHAEPNTEPQSSESENIAGEIAQPDAHHEPSSEDPAPENHDHDGHHDNHDNHDEWRG